MLRRGTGAGGAGQRKRRGVVLLSVTWCILILSLLLVSRLAREEIRFTHERAAHVELGLRLAVRSAEAIVLAGLAADAGTNAESRYDAFLDSWNWEQLRKDLKAELAESWPDVTLDVSIEDEQSKINPRKASPEAISRLLRAHGWPESQARKLAVEVVKAVKEAGEATPGRESGEPGGKAAEEAFVDLRCLLVIPGFSQELLYGEDMNFNGKLDPNENDGEESVPPDDRNGSLRPGLVRYFSVWGDGKFNPNLATEEVLLTVPGVSPKMAAEIVARRAGGDGIPGTDDDFLFTKLEDMQKLGSVSRFAEFEMRKLTPHLRMHTDIYQVRICATSRRTGQMVRSQFVVRRDKSKVRVISKLEDNGAV